MPPLVEAIKDGSSKGKEKIKDLQGPIHGPEKRTVMSKMGMAKEWSQAEVTASVSERSNENHYAEKEDKKDEEENLEEVRKEKKSKAPKEKISGGLGMKEESGKHPDSTFLDSIEHASKKGEDAIEEFKDGEREAK
ncbi:uncharacterized protein [Aristolochia californica]|uniref:uncharacterized protein n=1 Tax=Aristolochia californica TaxID=171875 RepID=UPI0035DB4B39